MVTLEVVANFKIKKKTYLKLVTRKKKNRMMTTNG